MRAATREEKADLFDPNGEVAVFSRDARRNDLN